MSDHTQNRAAILSAAGEQLKVQDVPTPAPEANQITIKVEAVAFNPVDVMMGKTGAMVASFPGILGCDAAGTITALGSEASSMGFKVGDRVAGATDHAGERGGKGVFQLYCNLQAGMTGKVPEGVSFKDACVLPICLATAAVGLFQQDTLGLPLPKLDGRDAGKTVVVWGGASSVGSCAIQMAKAAGLKVAATAGEYNLKYLKEIGVDWAFDYRSESVVKDIVAAVKGKGDHGGTFAAVMGREVYMACAEICIGAGGKQTVSTVLPPFMPFEEELPGGVQIAYSKCCLTQLMSCEKLC